MGFRSKIVSIGVMQSDFSPTFTKDSYLDHNCNSAQLSNQNEKIKVAILSRENTYISPYLYSKDYKTQKNSLFNEFHEVSAKA